MIDSVTEVASDAKPIEFQGNNSIGFKFYLLQLPRAEHGSSAGKFRLTSEGASHSRSTCCMI